MARRQLVPRSALVERLLTSDEPVVTVVAPRGTARPLCSRSGRDDCGLGWPGCRANGQTMSHCLSACEVPSTDLGQRERGKAAMPQRFTRSVHGSGRPGVGATGLAEHLACGVDVARPQTCGALERAEKYPQQRGRGRGEVLAGRLKRAQRCGRVTGTVVESRCHHGGRDLAPSVTGRVGGRPSPQRGTSEVVLVVRRSQRRPRKQDVGKLEVGQRR